MNLVLHDSCLFLLRGAGASIASMEALRSEIHQLRCGIQIRLRAHDVHVSHVGRKPGEARMQIYALPIPPREPLYGKGMPQVVRPRSDAAFLRFQSGFGKEATKRVVSRFDRQLTPIRAHEEPRIRRSGRVFHALPQVAIQLARQRAVKGNPSGTSLEGLNEKDSVARVYVSQTQP